MTSIKKSYTIFFQLQDYDDEDFIPDTEPLQQYISHTGGIYKVLLHSIQKDTFASCSTDCTIKIWKLKETKPKYGFKYDVNSNNFWP